MIINQIIVISLRTARGLLSIICAIAIPRKDANWKDKRKNIKKVKKLLISTEEDYRSVRTSNKCR